MESVPERRLEPPADKVVGYCYHCRGEIYDGEMHGQKLGTRICRDCLNELWESMTISDRFEWLGYTVNNGGC